MQSIYFQLINFILHILHSNTSLHFSLNWLKLILMIYGIFWWSFTPFCWVAPPLWAMCCLQQPQLPHSDCWASLEWSAPSSPGRLGRNPLWKQLHQKTCISWLKENLPQNNLTHTLGNASAFRITQFLCESLFIFHLTLFPIYHWSKKIYKALPLHKVTTKLL